MELVDTSVWARKDHPSIRGWFSDTLVNGQMALCDMVALEILSGFGSRDLFVAGAQYLDAVLCLGSGESDWKRAREVYVLLEVERDTNTRRSVKIPDLLIAACAERHGVQIVHYDRDFDTIAAITGQDVRWVAPRGSL
jgi:predicted nucleic acid-binding protein